MVVLSASAPTFTPASHDAEDEKDEKVAKAKAILMSAVRGKLPSREVDPKALQAREILTRAIARNTAGVDGKTDVDATYRNYGEYGMDEWWQSDDQQQFMSEYGNEPFGEEWCHGQQQQNQEDLSSEQMLRGYYEDEWGEWQPYYNGTLKSFNAQKGYGFLSCPEAVQFYGQDIFIHKNWVPCPHSIGQSVEFKIVLSARGQPQADDCKWLPKSQPSGLVVRRYDPNREEESSRREAEISQIFSDKGPSTVITPSKAINPVTSITPSKATNPAQGSAVVDINKPADNIAAMSQKLLREYRPRSGQELVATETPCKKEIGQTPSAAVFKQRKYLGIVTQLGADGYGYIESDAHANVYFVSSQFANLMEGSTVEFTLANETLGPSQSEKKWQQPEHIVVDSIPYRHDYRHQESTGAWVGLSKTAVTTLQGLLKHIHENAETAVVTAIDLQDRPASPSDNQDLHEVDYVMFVLDRLGEENRAVEAFGGFIKMLLMLMLSKMLRQCREVSRVEKLCRWIVAAAERIQPTREDQVKTNFPKVAQQIISRLQHAFKNLEESLDQVERRPFCYALSSSIATLHDKVKQCQCV